MSATKTDILGVKDISEAVKIMAKNGIHYKKNVGSGCIGCQGCTAMMEAGDILSNNKINNHHQRWWYELSPIRDFFVT